MAERSDRTRITAAGVGDASLITPAERDLEMDLHSPRWGERLLERGWIERSTPDRHFSRDVRIASDGVSTELRDHVIRFPSAPIYGTNRKRRYEVDLADRRPNMHTLRLLTRSDCEGQPVGRLFILHNGLNETDNLRLYYQLADWILREDEQREDSIHSACLVVPFPGHLMHYPFSGPFGQSALSRYLNDAGELFRQFLRYMVEMRWLMSVVNGPRPPAWTVGGELLPRGRVEAELFAEWNSLKDASLRRLTGAEEGGAIGATAAKHEEFVVGKRLEAADVRSTTAVLRALLHGSGDVAGQDSLSVHVVGYSLGGFLAQSVFFAWPNSVGSCATICSGGAIRALAPTAFAHPEEWQAVLHALRPEIEGSLMARTIARGADGITAGMSADQFGYFHRIFNQVFLQEDESSYKERLSEYGPRMLFVSGGDDPIVTTRNVLDASPAGGVTMLSVADLTHFLGFDARTAREVDQRAFWLPEVGGLIARAASRAEELKAAELKRARSLREMSARRKARSRNHTPRRPQGGDLYSPTFEQSLDWVIDLVNADAGWLFVCRNVVPAAFLPTEMYAPLGAALHHHDVRVQRYAAGLSRRAAALTEARQRLTLTLSAQIGRDFKDPEDLFDPSSDAIGTLSTRQLRRTAWLEFMTNWQDRIRWFEHGLLASGYKDGIVDRTFARRVSRWQGVPLGHMRVAHLPDVWISLGDGAGITLPSEDRDAAAANFVHWVSDLVREHQSASARKRPQPHTEKLAEQLEKGEVRIVRVAGSEFNPRYRGRLEQRAGSALQLLVHCAAALVRSTSSRGVGSSTGAGVGPGTR